MLILNTFISEETVVPEYTETSIKQTRKENPEIPILFICKQEQPWFKDLKVQWVSQDSLSKGTWLTKFNKVCKFNRHGTPNTTHPSPKNFWHRTAERIFYLREAINSYKLDNVFHFENDVMVYDSFDKIVNKLPNNIVSAIPMSQTHSTFALTFIPTIDSIDFMCEYFLNLLHKGERHLQRKGYDHISEMSLLNMAMRNGRAEQLPILPSRDLSNSVDLIFDPGSYGQFLGGTNNGHPRGFIDPTHFIGQYFGRTEDRPEIPFDDGYPYFQGSKIFNLHIHSKNLKDFYND
tara:strand:- start:2014 stop:2886 length:873 start_codon:yes stop_codon:yes gene_type:complete